MKLSGGQSCFLLIVLAFIIVGFQAAVQTPGGIAIVLLLSIAAIVGIFFAVRNSKRKHISDLLAQASVLDKLAGGDFSVDTGVFATGKSEEVVLHLNNITLKEYRSNGTSYSGGYGGVSFRVAKGLRANVGRTAGQSTRNPEVSTPLDVGGVTFTNERIVFAGHNMVREWDLAKIVSMSSDDNGVNLELAVSDREKASVLNGLHYPELTPGMAVTITLAWQKGGKKAAMEAAKSMAVELRSTIAQAQAK
jgi:hypothetical protein